MSYKPSRAEPPVDWEQHNKLIPALPIIISIEPTKSSLSMVASL